MANLLLRVKKISLHLLGGKSLSYLKGRVWLTRQQERYLLDNRDETQQRDPVCPKQKKNAPCFGDTLSGRQPLKEQSCSTRKLSFTTEDQGEDGVFPGPSERGGGVPGITFLHGWRSQCQGILSLARSACAGAPSCRRRRRQKGGRNSAQKEPEGMESVSRGGFVGRGRPQRRTIRGKGNSIILTKVKRMFPARKSHRTLSPKEQYNE